jgi:RNA polymerase-binding transcription factor DksA
MSAKKKPASKAPAKPVKKPAAKPAVKAASAKKPAAKAPAKPVKKAPAPKKSPPVKKSPSKPAAAKKPAAKKPAAKPAPKKPAAKPVAKKPAVKPAVKPAAKKPAAPVKKAAAPAPKPAAKKPVAKPAPAKAPAAKPAPKKSAPVAAKPAPKPAPAPAVKAAAPKSAPAKATPGKAAAGGSSKTKPKIINVRRDTSSFDEGITIEAPKKPVLPAGFLKKQRQRLVELRDAYMNAAEGVASESLRSHEGGEASAFGMHQADAGSDAYDRDFALSLLAKEQDAIYEINEALNRIDKGTYGICEMSGNTIPEERLEALPFTRFTVACQARLERDQRGGRWTRPVRSLFGLDESAEDSEDGDDDDTTTTTSSGGGSNESLDFGKE